MNSDLEFHRVAIGLNSNRSSLHEEIFFVAFTEDEVSEFGIEETPGDTGCRCANRCHVDITLTDAELLALCGRVLDNNRKCVKLNKPKMKAITKERNCGSLHEGDCT